MTSSSKRLPGFLCRSGVPNDSADDDESTEEEEEEDLDPEADGAVDSSNGDGETSDVSDAAGKPAHLSSKRRGDSFYDDEDIEQSLSSVRKHTDATSTVDEEDTATDRSAAPATNVDGLPPPRAPLSRELSGSSMASSITNTTADDWNSMVRPGAERKYTYRESQFIKTLSADVVKMAELRKLGWNGIPPDQRSVAWKIMLGYLPTNASRRQHTINRKRSEYRENIGRHYDIDDNSRTLQEQETLRQVLVDVPRTAPEIALFRNERIRRSLARMLYIWAMRHPASSYVQGINDLATPLFAVFLSDHYGGEDVLDGTVMVLLPDERLQEVEADCYWCLTNILAGIQDHYTADQPGVQRMVMRLEELVQRIDADLCEHFRNVGIQFMQFAFKWMNCLLLREFNLRCVIRLWDTYISEDGFEDFHVYVCAAFLCQFSSHLQSMDFDELFQFMQKIPTSDWGDTEIEMLLSQAYVLSTLFGGSDAHLTSGQHM